MKARVFSAYIKDVDKRGKQRLVEGCPLSMRDLKDYYKASSLRVGRKAPVQYRMR